MMLDLYLLILSLEENPEIIEGSEETGEGDTQELTEDEIGMLFYTCSAMKHH